MKIFRKVIALFFIVLIAFGGYFVGTWVFTGNPPEIIESVLPTNYSKTILVLGMDNEGLRSDVMMLAFINSKTGNVDLLSIPRDTRVLIGGKAYKINSAFALGKEPQSIDTVEKLLGVKIDNYVKFSFDTFRNVIDALGGVDYDVPQDMKYSDPEQSLKINLKKGMQHLDGNKAEQLVRFRHYPMGDEDRIKVQQAFVKELIKQKLNPAIIAKIPQLASEIGNNVKTDIPGNEWLGLANIARKMSSESLSTYQIPGEAKTIDSLSYYIVSDSETKTLISEVITRYNATK